MIGKNNLLNYSYLVSIISVTVLVNSFYFKNFYLAIFYIFAICTSILSTKYGIKFLKKYNILQKIRDDGPASHLIKNKTPTMGGLFIIPIIFLMVLFFDIPSFALKINLLITIAGFFFIGITDDYLSIKNRLNLGLKSHEKFFLQIIITSFFLIFLLNSNLLNPSINLLNKNQINFEILAFPISLITIVGLSNAVNLTDGLDGLASGCSSIVFCGLGTEILLNGDKNLIIFSLLSFTMSGLCLGFLKYNKYPAKIFIGDTGSLSIGGLIGIICVITNSFLTTFIISGIFVLETISVLLQVSFFKITKKFLKKGQRLFLMTPIHHHFELKGIKEEKIVEIFWIINIFLVIFSIVLKISF